MRSRSSASLPSSRRLPPPLPRAVPCRPTRRCRENGARRPDAQRRALRRCAGRSFRGSPSLLLSRITGTTRLGAPLSLLGGRPRRMPFGKSLGGRRTATLHPTLAGTGRPRGGQHPATVLRREVPSGIQALQRRGGRPLAHVAEEALVVGRARLNAVYTVAMFGGGGISSAAVGACWALGGCTGICWFGAATPALVALVTAWRARPARAP